MTSLRPVHLTRALDSLWFEFSILSHNGKQWEKHCTGGIKGDTRQKFSTASVVLDSRKVSPASWYRILRKAGLRYGRAFEGMTEIYAGIVTKGVKVSPLETAKALARLETGFVT